MYWIENCNMPTDPNGPYNCKGHGVRLAIVLGKLLWWYIQCWLHCWGLLWIKVTWICIDPNCTDEQEKAKFCDQCVKMVTLII